MRKVAEIALIFASITTLGYAAEEEASFYVAQKAFSDGFYRAAESLTRKFIQDFPQSKHRLDAKFLLAKVYFYEKKYNDAEKLLQELANKENITESLRGEIIYWQGQLKLKSKEYKEAINIFSQVVNGYHNLDIYWWAFYSLAFAYLKESDIDNAMVRFEQIIENCPHAGIKEEAFYNLATLFYKQHQYTKLKDICSRWEKKISSSKYIAYIKFYKGEVAYNTGNISAAEKLYRSALEQAEDMDLKDSLYQSLGWIYLKEGEYTSAQKEFLKISSQEIKLYSLAVLAARQNNHLEALNYFSRFCQEFPHSHLIYKSFLGLADSFYALGRINDAMTWYKKLLGKEKEIKDANTLTKARYGLGWCYLKKGDFSRAIEQFNKLVASSSDHIVEISAAINIADAYQEKGDYKKAIASYKEISEKFPANVYSDYIQMQIGICLLKSKDWQQASLVFRALEENYPHSHLKDGAEYYTALSYFFLGRYQEALKILEGFRKKFPQSIFVKDAYQLEKEIYLHQKDYEAVFRVYGQIQKVFSQDSDLYQNIEIEKALLYIKLNKTRLAENILLELLKKFPASHFRPDIEFYLSSLYYSENKLSKAKFLLKRIIDDFPSSSFASRARYNLAQILWEEGKEKESVEIMKELFQDKTDSISSAAGLSLIDVLVFQKNYSQALEICDKMIQRNSSDKGFVFFKKAQIYFDVNNYASAIDSYNQALKNNFDSAELRFNLGLAYEKKRDISSAIKEYWSVIYLFKKSQKFVVKSYLRLGRIYEEKKDYHNAAKIYKKLAELNVDESGYAQRKLQDIEEKLAVNNR